jgi:hypothetical protein
MLAIVSLLIIATVSLLVNRIATVALTVTGMSREAARFQARSALTGVGFTTLESENIVNHPIRRRIVMWLMLANNIGIVTTAAALIGSFANTGGPSRALLRALVLLAGLAALLFACRNQWVERRLSKLIGRVVCRVTNLQARDYAHMLRLAGEYAVSELQVQADDWLVGKTLADADLSHEGVLVLGITRPDGTYIGAPTGGTRVEALDSLMLYGRAPVLAELDERHFGPDGDRAHRAALEEQRRIVQEERLLDPDRLPQASGR